MKTKLTKFDYYDSVKFLKHTEPELYTHIKKIHKMKTENCKWNNDKTFYPNRNRSFLESKNGYYYKLMFRTDTIILRKHYSGNIKLNAKCDPIIEIGKNDKSKQPLISIANTVIYDKFCGNSKIFKVYELGNESYKFFIAGPLELLYNYFNIKIETLNLSTQKESQVKSLLENTNHSVNSIINICMENDITEPDEENLFYLKLLLSD